MQETVSVFSESRKALKALHANLESKLDRDVIAVIGPILFGAEHNVRAGIEAVGSRRNKLAVVLNTGGGIVEVAERMVNVFRHYYSDVTFIIPDIALSAGTVLAMSGDEIMMDFFSCLGPIDPQIERDKKLVPALSYLVQYKRLIAKSVDGTLTTAEYVLLGKFDLAELHQYEEAKELSKSLLVRWLATYKFKDWNVTESGKQVTQAVKEARAEEIAEKLSNHEHWHSHGRGIPMQVLRDYINLRIEDFGQDPALSRVIRDYYQLAKDYMLTNSLIHLVHTRDYL